MSYAESHSATQSLLATFPVDSGNSDGGKDGDLRIEKSSLGAGDTDQIKKLARELSSYTTRLMILASTHAHIEGTTATVTHDSDSFSYQVSDPLGDKFFCRRLARPGVTSPALPI